jgi:hypothetical protein
MAGHARRAGPSPCDRRCARRPGASSRRDASPAELRSAPPLVCAAGAGDLRLPVRPGAGHAQGEFT